MSEEVKTFLKNYYLPFLEEMRNAKIFWLNIDEDFDYWKDYPPNSWEYGKNNDYICYGENKVKESSKGDLGIFYQNQKGVQHIGRVYKIQKDATYFEIIAKLSTPIPLREIRDIDISLANYPPQGKCSRTTNQKELTGLKVILQCLERQEPLSKEEKNMKNPLNQILYGPPGTGKTYHTIDKALEVLGEYSTNQNREERKQTLINTKNKDKLNL